LAGAKRKSLGDLWANADLAILAANKGNALVVLNAVYYIHEMVPSYARFEGFSQQFF
jgi:hypothetical protein